MKTPSTFLHDLVKSLTKAEKRYLKVNSGANERNYIQLFEALLTQKVYDEEQLVKEFEGANFLKHLAVNKQYLYELLLRSLTKFGQQKVEDKVYQKINAVHVLYEKGLFKAAMVALKKGQNLAQKYELYDLLILLYSAQKKLITHKQFRKKEDKSIQEVYEAEAFALQQIKNTNEYWYLTQQITQFQLKFQRIQNEEQQKYLEEITQSPLFQNQNLATNFKSKVYYFQANATYYFLQGNVKEAYQTNEAFLNLLEAQPTFLKIYVNQYLATLNNMLIDSLIIGKYDILEEGINRLLKIPKRPEFKSIKNIESRVFRQRYLLLLNWSLRQKEFEKAMEWMPDIENGLEQFGTKIEKHHRITFYYLNAYLCFQNQLYEDALKWNNYILNTKKEDVVKEVFHFARDLNLLIHYELGNYDLLESLLQSTPQYLRSRRPIYTTEKALFRVLGKLLKSIDNREKQTIIHQFRIEINQLAENPKEKRVFNFLDLRFWPSNSH